MIWLKSRRPFFLHFYSLIIHTNHHPIETIEYLWFGVFFAIK